ncbi:MAG: hypothetical protein J6Q72_07440 [Clostridia bacterium]|nr:hypothetical protein [Clostridia bacterium]
MSDNNKPIETNEPAKKSAPKPKKSKAKPISVGVALIMAFIAFAVMGTFLSYMFTSGGSGEVSADISIEQSFAESSLAPEKSEAEVKETMADANVGDAVRYGSYEQDGNGGEAELIEWIVLEKSETELLLISRYCIDVLPYNTTEAEAVFTESSLYKWLNGDFLGNAFTEAERAFIKSEITVHSAEQAKKYYEYDSWRATSATVYARSKGIKESGGNCLWWLSDKGEIANSASYVYYNGGIYTHGYAVDYALVGVRPVISVSLNAENEAE